MRLLAAFGQLMRRAAHELRADMILADTGPNLGAINRSVLLASDYVAIVLGTDFFSLRGLRPRAADMQPIGYLCRQHGVRLDVPMAEECRKPIFKLTSAYGDIGSHAGAVADAKKEFTQLAANIAIRIGMEGQSP